MSTPPDATSTSRAHSGAGSRGGAPARRGTLDSQRGVATVCSLLIHAALFLTVPTCNGGFTVVTEAEEEQPILALIDLAGLADLGAVEELDTGGDAGAGRDTDTDSDQPAASEDLRDEAWDDDPLPTDPDPTSEAADGITDNGGSTDDADGARQGNTADATDAERPDSEAGPTEVASDDAVADAQLDEPESEEPSESADEADDDEEPGPPEEEEEDEGTDDEAEVDEPTEDESDEDPPTMSEFVATSGGSVATEPNDETSAISELEQTAEVNSRSVLLQRSREQEIGTTDNDTKAEEERRKAGHSDAREGVRIAGGRRDRAQALRRGAVGVAAQPAARSARPKPTLHISHASASVRPLPADYADVEPPPEWWAPAAARIVVSGRDKAGVQTPEEAPPAELPSPPAEAPEPPSKAPEPTAPAPPAEAAPVTPPAPPTPEAPRTGVTPRDGALDAVADIDREGDTSEGGDELEIPEKEQTPDDRPIAENDGLLLVDKGVQGADEGEEHVTVEAPSLFEPMFEGSPGTDDDTTHVTGTESTLSQRYVLGLDNAVSARRTPLGAYTHKVYRRLLRNWERMPEPDMGLISLNEQVTISFLVFPDGRVVRAKVKTTSGDPTLDGLALASVPKSLPTFPKRLEESSLYYEMTFTYGTGR